MNAAQVQLYSYGGTRYSRGHCTIADLAVTCMRAYVCVWVYVGFRESVQTM